MTRRRLLLLASGFLAACVSTYASAWSKQVHGASLTALAPSQANIGFLAFRLAQDGRTVATVYQGGPAERAGLRTGDVIMDIDGGPVSDRGGVAGTVARVGVRRGEQNLSIEIGRIARTEVNWGAGVFHADKERVWRALVLALTSPELSPMFRVRQALKDEGVIFCDRAGPLGFTGGDLLREDIVYPEREIVNTYPYAIWVTPSLRLREAPGAAVVEVTTTIEYRGLTVVFSGTAKSAGGLEGKVFVQTWRELAR